MTCLGHIQPDPVGQMLRTGYSLFQSPSGINGLVKEKGSRLDLLVVDATVPGTGQFRNFISQCKEQYQTICIWEIWNPFLEPVLLRYGFHPETEVQGSGEVVVGVRWDRT